jgi:hypothetical protein
MLAAQEAQRKAAFNASFQLIGTPPGKTISPRAAQKSTFAASAKARAVSTMIPVKAVMLAYTAVLIGSRELAIRAVYQGQEGKKVQIYLWLDPRSAVMDTIMDLDRLNPVITSSCGSRQSGPSSMQTSAKPTSLATYLGLQLQTLGKSNYAIQTIHWRIHLSTQLQQDRRYAT